MEIYVLYNIMYNIHASIKYRTGLLQDVSATLAATLYIRYLGPIERTEWIMVLAYRSKP